jgi:hypothetical protein
VRRINKEDLAVILSVLAQLSDSVMLFKGYKQIKCSLITVDELSDYTQPDLHTGNYTGNVILFNITVHIGVTWGLQEGQIPLQYLFYLRILSFLCTGLKKGKNTF